MTEAEFAKAKLLPLGVWHISHIKYFMEAQVGRELSMEEVEQALNRIHSTNRDPNAITWNDVERSK